MGPRSSGSLEGALATALRLVSLRSRPFGTLVGVGVLATALRFACTVLLKSPPFGTLVGVGSPVTALRFACTVLLKSRPFGTLVGVGVLTTALRFACTVLLKSRPFGTLVGSGLRSSGTLAGALVTAPRLVSLILCLYVAWDTPASFINFKKKGLML